MPKIPTRHLMHGAALYQLVPEGGILTIEAVENGYIINDRMSIYLKMTTRGGSAQFTFTPENVQDMMAVQRQSDTFYLALISPAHGVCALTWDEFASLVAIEPRVKTLSVRRGHGKRFRVTGTDAEEALIIPANRWDSRLVPL